MGNKNSGDEKLLDHSYDGIQEYDNPMPRWWVWIFWATIVFSLIYYFDFTGRVKGPGRIAEYQAQLKAAEQRWPVAASAGADSAGLAAMLADPAARQRGKTVYDANCTVCHRADGGGLIGPNLADEYWLHGGTIVAIRKTIAEGVLDKGMPNWGKMLSIEQVDAVAVYIASLAGTVPPSPKAPQGTKSGEGVVEQRSGTSGG